MPKSGSFVGYCLLQFPMPCRMVHLVCIYKEGNPRGLNRQLSQHVVALSGLVGSLYSLAIPYVLYTSIALYGSKGEVRCVWLQAVGGSKEWAVSDCNNTHTHVCVFLTRVCSKAGGVREGHSLAVGALFVVGDDKVQGRNLCKQESVFGMWETTGLLSCQPVHEQRPHSYMSLLHYLIT